MALWEWRPGVHAQRDAAGVGAERKPIGLDEPQLVTLDHDSELFDNDEAAVVGPGVARKRDSLVREHAGHVVRLVAVEPHVQDKCPLRHSRPHTCLTWRPLRPDDQVNYGSRVDGVARRLDDGTLWSIGEDLRRGL